MCSMKVTPQQKVDLASEYVVVFFNRCIYLGFNDPLHGVLILPEVVHDLLKSRLLGCVTDRPYIRESEERKRPLKKRYHFSWVDNIFPL
jgi:hypothetical protein